MIGIMLLPSAEDISVALRLKALRVLQTVGPQYRTYFTLIEYIVAGIKTFIQFFTIVFFFQMRTSEHQDHVRIVASNRWLFSWGLHDILAHLCPDYLSMNSLMTCSILGFTEIAVGASYGAGASGSPFSSIVLLIFGLA
jgi:hypothetical protein